MSHQPVPSKAAIKGHPLHPVMIPFPIAFGSAVVVTDVAYWIGDTRGWALASAWLLWATFGTGVIAALLGAIDYFGVREIREHRMATWHGAGNAAALLVVLVNGLIRIADVEDAVLPWGLVLSVVTVAIIGVTGYMGGELSYKHMIGVNPRASEPGSPITGSRR